LKKTDRGHIVFIDQEETPKIEDQQSHLISGPEDAQNLKLLEWAETKTTVLQKGHVEIDGELRG
jgi:hypothetical protein